MSDSSHRTFRPEKPLLVWDGECGFCRMCVERFVSQKKEGVNLVPFQELHRHWPQAPEEDYASAVILYTPDGQSYRAAAAIYRFYAEFPWRGWAFWLYSRFRWFTKLSEWGYTFVAEHRKIFARLVRIFWGKSFVPSTYLFSSWLFCRFLGLTALIAFLSLWVQAEGLIGPEGIVPFQDDLEHVRNITDNGAAEISRWWLRPTLLWFFSDVTGLHIIFTIGTLAALLLIVGIAPHVAVFAGWICYLSLVVVAEPFLNFQWDLLMLETMFISLFFVPWQARERRGLASHPSPLGRWLIWLLLFKLTFGSGLVKFTYFGPDGSNTWYDLTALDYHYWTQPIPSWLSWYFHQLPVWFDKISLITTYVIEVILPFFIFFPRRLRNLAFIGLVFLQVMIIITGNYGFFNLLTMILCLPLVDDHSLPERLKKLRSISGETTPKSVWPRRVRFSLVTLVTVMFLWTGSYYLRRDFLGNRPQTSGESFSPSGVSQSLIRYAQFSRSMNSYGLFRVMTTSRPEIIIEHSHNGETWLPYQFRYKPGDQQVPPAFFFPHMPRLDWQMWFEALYIERLISAPYSLSLYQRFLEVMVMSNMNMGELHIGQFLIDQELQGLNAMTTSDRRQFIQNIQMHINSYSNHSYWFASFLRSLGRGNETVLDLLSSDWVEMKNPKKMRITFYYYNFSDPDAKKKTGIWWNRDPVDQFSLTFPILEEYSQ